MSLGLRCWRFTTRAFVDRNGQTQTSENLVGPGFYTPMDCTEKVAAPAPVKGPFYMHSNYQDEKKRMTMAEAFWAAEIIVAALNAKECEAH